MHPKETPLSHEESLQLIGRMIQSARQEARDDGSRWIIWGWLLFATCMCSWINLQYFWVDTWFFWNAFGIVSLSLLLFDIVRRMVRKSPARVRTQATYLYRKLNIGFFLSLVLIIVAMNVAIEPTIGFALMLGLYAFWILIYGAVTDFRPSVIAAFITFGFAFASLFVHDFRTTLLLHAAAVLCGYIIPGHLANRAFRKNRTPQSVPTGV
ncbi:MAG: hypothetical protein EOO08_01330 [Chitinophagaceae bacterium]|nr:MAG: hypothetical protein EOO08_01330 [Chitinophagaceae bacterium]